MLTPQEVEERVFPKAKKGGYDMADVDSFLDQITADYTDLYKDNAVLKRRLKTLADKITEYQETEGAMRATLRAAQKMAEQIVEEARTKSEKMLAESEEKVRSQTEEITVKVAEEEARLAAAKESLARLTSGIRTVITREQDFLDRLPNMDAAEAVRSSEVVPESPEAEAPEETEPTDDLDLSFRHFLHSEPEPEPEEEPEPEGEYVGEEPAGPEVSFAEEPEEDFDENFADDFEADFADDAFDDVPPEEEPPAAPAAARPVSRRIVDEDVDDTPTRRLDLSELRFGKNYEVK